jgi:hypothetical protein
VIFRFHDKQHAPDHGRASQDATEKKSAQVDFLIMRLRQGLIALPPGDEVVKFVNCDGQAQATTMLVTATELLDLNQLRDRYLATYSQANDSNTLKTKKTYFRHLATILGPTFCLAELRTPHIQRHIDPRAKPRISPVTI